VFPFCGENLPFFHKEIEKKLENFSILNSTNFAIFGSNFAKILIPKKRKIKCAHPP
jgi:hypothetical protein